MWTDDIQPVATELRGPGRTDEEGNIAASLGEPGAKVAADRTGADKEDSQSYVRTLYSASPSRRGGAAMITVNRSISTFLIIRTPFSNRFHSGETHPHSLAVAVSLRSSR